ncbi:MAG: HAMP domain-containing histidine kinase [Clostridia bacterium]|nr:HAMP domain-containing histidine kinase [Clostridia bacterium]
MIKKLKRKFILIASGALLFVIVMIIGMIGLGNYARTLLQVDAIIDYIVENNGELPRNGGVQEDKSTLGLTDYNVRPETPYEIRYFCVFLEDDDNIAGYNFEHIASVSEETADSFVGQVQHGKTSTGYFSSEQSFYAYRTVTPEDAQKYIIFLDCTTYITASNAVIYLGVLIGVICFIIFCIVVSFFAKIAIKPIVTNMEKQKQFITNAGHELKTPLAIISANTEVMEMINGKNEWTESTIHQVKRLSGLVNNLITLARMEESDDIVLHTVDFSAQALDVAESFKTVAAQQNKAYRYDIQPGITVKGDENLLHELVSILTDNAIKYCDADGNIAITLSYRNKGKSVRLTVSNTYAEGAHVDYSRFFERFYRQDDSHNSKKAGYGIGLSMAREIVSTCKGKISVDYKDGTIFFIVTF